MAAAESGKNVPEDKKASEEDFKASHEIGAEDEDPVSNEPASSGSERRPRKGFMKLKEGERVLDASLGYESGERSAKKMFRERNC